MEQTLRVLLNNKKRLEKEVANASGADKKVAAAKLHELKQEIDELKSIIEWVDTHTEKGAV